MLQYIRLLSVQTLVWQRAVDIQHHVDAGNVEDASTLIVVQGWVDVVDSDSIHTESLHESSITEADLAIGERILARLWLVSGRSAWLIGDTHDLETLSSSFNNEIWALDGEWLDGGGELGTKREKRN